MSENTNETKVIDIDVEYFLNREKEAQGALLDSKFDEALDILKEPISKIDEFYQSEIYCPQNVFDSAILLNYLGKEVSQKSFAKVNFFDFYLIAGSANYNMNNKEEAREYYRKAIKLNPASSIARIFDIRISEEINDYDDLLGKFQDALYFAYNRADMGKIYKLAGDYLVHKKDFENAMVSYHLSMIYDLNDEMADIISKVATDNKIDLDNSDYLSEEKMKKFYDEYKIPLMPNDKLSELALAMGDDAYNKRSYAVAKYSYKIAYDLTFDEKIKSILDEIERKSNKVFNQ